MPARPLTIAARLRKAFLKGQTISPTAFARRKPVVDVSNVGAALAQMRPLVQSDGKGNWVCIDVAGMRAYITPERADRLRRKREAGQRARAKTSAELAWCDLLGAWGIPITPPEIDLPQHFHTWATAEDNKPDNTSWIDKQ